MKRIALRKLNHLPAPGLLNALRQLLTKKIWLPTILYEGLPYFYAAAGVIAVTSTLFVSSWYWVLPYYWILGLLCLHAAIYIWRVRRHYRHLRRDADAQVQDLESPTASGAASKQLRSQQAE